MIVDRRQLRDSRAAHFAAERLHPGHLARRLRTYAARLCATHRLERAHASRAPVSTRIIVDASRSARLTWRGLWWGVVPLSKGAPIDPIYTSLNRGWSGAATGKPIKLARPANRGNSSAEVETWNASCVTANLLLPGLSRHLNTCPHRCRACCRHGTGQ